MSLLDYEYKRRISASHTPVSWFALLSFFFVVGDVVQIAIHKVLFTADSEA